MVGGAADAMVWSGAAGGMPSIRAAKTAARPGCRTSVSAAVRAFRSLMHDGYL